MVVAQRKAQLIKGKHGGLSFIPRTHIKEHASGQEVCVGGNMLIVSVLGK